MKPIKKGELYSHLSGFLKARGIELKEGSYTQSIQKGCSILADTINLSQQGFERAKTGIDRQLESMRQFVHEKTAPPAPPPPVAKPSQKGPKASGKKPAQGKRPRSKKAKR